MQTICCRLVAEKRRKERNTLFKSKVWQKGAFCSAFDETSLVVAFCDGGSDIHPAIATRQELSCSKLTTYAGQGCASESALGFEP